MFDRISQGLWWDKAWSLVDGCTPVSPACANCWAAAQTQMRANHPNDKVRGRAEGLTADGHFNGQIQLNEEFLYKPLRTKKPTAWAIWNDLFHEDVPVEFIWKAFNVMGESSKHTFLILTKRPERMKKLCILFKDTLADLRERGEMYCEWPLPNVWLGVTAENQQTADARIPFLLQTPAAVRFVSVEPMLGPVDLKLDRRPPCSHKGCYNHITHPCDGCGRKQGMLPLDWVICGGESGPNARPMHPKWARSLQSQCQDAGVPFFFKQWGEWFPRDQWEHNPELVLPDDEFAYHDSPKTHVFKDLGDVYPVHRVGKKAAGRLLDGKERLEIPEVKL